MRLPNQVLSVAPQQQLAGYPQGILGRQGIRIFDQGQQVQDVGSQGRIMVARIGAMRAGTSVTEKGNKAALGAHSL